MTISINAPDGTQVQFPDGTDDGTIKSVMAKNYPSAQSAVPALRGSSAEGAPGPTAAPAAPAAPSATPSLPAPSKGTASPTTGARPASSSQALGFDQGIVQPILNAGVGIEKTLGAFGIPSINKWLGGHSASEIRDAHAKWLADQEDPNAADNDAPGQSRKPGLAGQIAGELISTAPVLMATRNPWLIGAGSGALTSTANTAKGVAGDTAFGAVAGKAGDTLVRAAGSVVKPVWKASVEKLLGEGVKLTPGQITGGPLHRIEDASMSFPLVGDMVSARSREAEDSFQRAAINRALHPIGTQVPDDLSGHAGVEHAQNAISDAYDNVLPHVQVHMSPKLYGDINSLEAQAGQDLNPDMRDQFKRLIKDKVISVFNRAQANAQNPNMPIVGSELKDIETTLNNESKQFGKSNDPFHQKYAAYVNDLKQTIHDEMGAQNPHLKPALDAADTGYANLARVEAAANSARGGRFTPAQLEAATRNMSQGVRRGAGSKTSASGGALMQDLSSAGADAMSRTVPDSGTAMRALVNTGAAGVLYGVAPHLALNPLTMAGAAAVVSPYTKLGGRAIRALMTKRPAGAMAVRRVIDKAATPAADTTAATIGAKRSDRGKWRANGTHLEFQPAGSDKWIDQGEAP